MHDRSPGGFNGGGASGLTTPFPAELRPNEGLKLFETVEGSQADRREIGTSEGCADGGASRD
jgi:hypothetical protein